MKHVFAEILTFNHLFLSTLSADYELFLEIRFYLKKQNRDITIVCSGRLGEEVIEDNLCAEYIQWGFDNVLSKFRLTSEQIYDECLVSPSYLMLKSAGLEADFDFCMQIDSHNIVPVLDNDGFILI